ncbi:MAG: Serine-tRNA ligase [Microgenomates group bacterium GW2011_GWB1_40_9]|nr:MAG: Serine-tRNA ligase [Microgenomates group bacterium GW2011_GWB1_40_9]
MLDINFIKENLELCKTAAINKNRMVDWERLVTLDETRRKLTKSVDDLRAQRNEISKKPIEIARVEGKQIKESLKGLEEELKKVEEELQVVLNVEVRKWGEMPVFDYTIRDHIELAKKNDLIDFERGTKVGGFRAYFLKNEAVLLEMGILNYTLRKLVEKGYTPLIAPALVKEFTLFGNAQLPWGRDEIYHLEKDDLYLSGTAEIPVTSYLSDEILLEKDLPKKFVAFSPCFRREAGSYGKDTKGIYRLHQFNKIEQVIISTADSSKSLTLLEELLANAEEILRDLELPYRILSMCTGDMGEPQVKKYDIETWMPSRNAYGETMSDSFMGDFQARRLKIRYRTKDGKMVFCHTLNNTAIASPRILIPILENYQQKDGSIRVPKVLVPFVGKEVISR